MASELEWYGLSCDVSGGWEATSWMERVGSMEYVLRYWILWNGYKLRGFAPVPLHLLLFGLRTLYQSTKHGIAIQVHRR